MVTYDDLMAKWAKRGRYSLIFGMLLLLAMSALECMLLSLKLLSYGEFALVFVGTSLITLFLPALLTIYWRNLEIENYFFGDSRTGSISKVENDYSDTQLRTYFTPEVLHRVVIVKSQQVYAARTESSAQPNCYILILCRKPFDLKQLLKFFWPKSKVMYPVRMPNGMQIARVTNINDFPWYRYDTQVIYSHAMVNVYDYLLRVFTTKP